MGSLVYTTLHVAEWIVLTSACGPECYQMQHMLAVPFTEASLSLMLWLLSCCILRRRWSSTSVAIHREVSFVKKLCVVGMIVAASNMILTVYNYKKDSW